MRYVLSVGLAILCIGSFAMANNAQSSKKSIKDVMKAGMGGGPNSLCAKVAGGSATAEEKVKFLDLLVDLVENDAPKGDATEWKMMSGTLMIAAAKAVAGREGAADAVKAAANCKGCHDKFKGK